MSASRSLGGGGVSGREWLGGVGMNVVSGVWRPRDWQRERQVLALDWRLRRANSWQNGQGRE